jgi:HrpA-like RNA helicase
MNIKCFPKGNGKKICLNFKALFCHTSFECCLTITHFESLPAYQIKEDVVKTIESNQITVVSGATGSGKSTQVPQLVLDDMILRNKGSEASIIMTQPRRISAIGVAERIASERCEHVGETIGYSIRLESKKSSKTRLLLCTTGILLRRLQCDPGKRKKIKVSVSNSILFTFPFVYYFA